MYDVKLDQNKLYEVVSFHNNLYKYSFLILFEKLNLKIGIQYKQNKEILIIFFI